MTRLDVFLVENAIISTRSRAKRAILYGLVKVNGKIIQKPAFSIKPNDQVDIINELASKSAGYWKLYSIVQKVNLKLFSPTDYVLDLGSSAGGFLEYAAEHCKQVFGIEVSDEFAPELDQLGRKYPNIKIFIEDVFTLDPQKITVLEQVDIILNDLTLDPVASVQILSRFLPLLKVKGYILMAVKLGEEAPESYQTIIQKYCKNLDLDLLEIINLDPDKKELHFIAKKQK